MNKKVCRYCMNEIHEKAKVCPYCCRNQYIHLVFIFVMIAFLLSLAILYLFEY